VRAAKRFNPSSAAIAANNKQISKWVENIARRNKIHQATLKNKIVALRAL
jgi:hypothetical protein